MSAHSRYVSQNSEVTMTNDISKFQKYQHIWEEFFACRETDKRREVLKKLNNLATENNNGNINN